MSAMLSSWISKGAEVITNSAKSMTQLQAQNQLAGPDQSYIIK